MALTSLAATVRSDAFWAVRQSAAHALARFAPARATSPAATSGSGPSDASSAGGAGPDSIARDALIAATRDADARVRQAAASSLAAFTGAGVGDALRALVGADSSYIVRGAALIALAQVDPTSATPAIGEALRHESWLDIERTAAVRALAFVPTEAAWDTLLTFLAPATVRETREAAIASLLARSKGREAELAQALVPVLNAPDFYSRADAAAALGQLKQPSSIAPLEVRRQVEAESRVINAIDAAIAEIRGTP